MPLTGQRGQQRQPGPAAGVQGQVDVLERPLQRELGSVVTAGDLVQLGVGDRRVERTALDGRVEGGHVDTQPPGQFHGLGDPFDQRGHVGVDHQLQPAALARRAEPDRVPPDRRERLAEWLPRGIRPGRQNEQPPLLGGPLAAGHRGIDEQ
jgi:hypothetical protein